MAQVGNLEAETETLSQVLRLVEAFRAFDADNDGVINAAELDGIMGSLGYNPSEDEVTAMMRQGDTNQDGLLSIEEFLDMNTKELGLGGALVSFLSRASEALNIEIEDDCVSGEELHEVMVNTGVADLSPEDCEAIIASMDGDGDGAISLEDFRLIVNALI